MRQPIVRWTLATLACVVLCTAPAAQAAPERADAPAVASWLDAILSRTTEELRESWEAVTPFTHGAAPITGGTDGPGEGEGALETLGGTCDPGTSEHGCSIDPNG